MIKPDTFRKQLIVLLAVSICIDVSSKEVNTTLTLEETVATAIRIDPWLMFSKHQEAALHASSVAASTLPDPKVSILAANMPTDSFDFDREGITQLKLGVTQVFPRGDSLSLKQKQLELLSDQHPLQREDRKAKLAVKSAMLWMDAYKAQESIELIESSRSLFEQLSDIAEAGYSSAIGKTRQQDIIRAQLELARLDDRLASLSQQEEAFKQMLSEQLNQSFLSEYSSISTVEKYNDLLTLRLNTSLPSLSLIEPSILSIDNLAGSHRVLRKLEAHPAVNSVSRKIAASKTGIELSMQKYKSEWGLSASYGYRNNTLQGLDRSNLFSIGITFDLPIFTSRRQDQDITAAIAKSESVKTEKWLVLRKFIAAIKTQKVKYSRLSERQFLYQSQLLPQTHELAVASLTAYTNDAGDFSEVVRSHIAELNAEIDYLEINVEKLKSIIQLNYYFMKSADEVIFSVDA